MKNSIMTEHRASAQTDRLIGADEDMAADNMISFKISQTISTKPVDDTNQQSHSSRASLHNLLEEEKDVVPDMKIEKIEGFEAILEREHESSSASRSIKMGQDAINQTMTSHGLRSSSHMSVISVGSVTTETKFGHGRQLGSGSYQSGFGTSMYYNNQVQSIFKRRSIQPLIKKPSDAATSSEDPISGPASVLQTPLLPKGVSQSASCSSPGIYKQIIAEGNEFEENQKLNGGPN